MLLCWVDLQMHSYIEETFQSMGSTASHYDDFFGPLYFEPFALAIGKRIEQLKVANVLELASGTGRVTRHIRENIPASAKLIASDIDREMLAIAREKLGHNDIEWQHIDAQRISSNENSFDLVVCCFGYMFVADKQKAFAEAYRVLKPGGRLLFTTWDKLSKNRASYVSLSIATEYLHGPLPESYHTPTSMSEEPGLRALLTDAGFKDLSIEKLSIHSEVSSAKEAAEGFIMGGGVYDEIKRNNPAVMNEIQIRLEEEFAEQFGASPMIVPVSAVIAEGRK